MSPGWRPDDSILDRNRKGEVKAVRRAQDALRKQGITIGDRILTSRDRGMAAVNRALKQTGLPTGVQHWQLPVPLGSSADVVAFISRLKPGALVPDHAHKVGVFRIVMSGSLLYDRHTFKTGDWMYVPPGQAYSVQAGPEGCVIFYGHWPIPWPWPWPFANRKSARTTARPGRNTRSRRSARSG